MSSTNIRLVTRGDDAGSCHSANLAVKEACEKGIVRNASIMVPGPAFDEAASLLSGVNGISIGLHVTLNAEWETPKWGPVLPVDRVPSLVDENGYFTPAPKDLHDRGFDLDEICAEVEAQLARARGAGLKVSYLDEHMGVSWLAGLQVRLADLCVREGLVEARALSLKSLPMPEEGDLVNRVISALRKAEPGTYLWVTHPGMDEPDMREFGVSIARERNRERLALRDPRLIAACRELGVELIKYTDV